MEITHFSLFFISAGLLVISPGPDLLLISTYASVRGFLSGLMIAIGILVAGLLQTTLVAVGLGKLMQEIPLLTMTIKIMGACYLAWIGIKLLAQWFKDRSECHDAVHVKNINNVKPMQLFSQGLFNNLMNPKALLFFSLFLPQFTQKNLDLTHQLFVLGCFLSVMAFVFNAFVSALFSQVGKYLSGKLRVGHHVNGLLGMIFLGLATRLVVSR